jgi:hypothetical protein
MLLYGFDRLGLLLPGKHLDLGIHVLCRRNSCCRCLGVIGDQDRTPATALNLTTIRQLPQRDLIPTLVLLQNLNLEEARGQRPSDWQRGQNQTQDDGGKEKDNYRQTGLR